MNATAGYRNLIEGPLAKYVQHSNQIGGHVAEHAKLVQEAFNAQLNYVEIASSRADPGQSAQVELLGPTSSKILAIQEFREKNRSSTYFNHLSAVSESIPALGWVTIKPAPAPYIKEMSDAGQFYTNRVLKDWKEKDKTHVEWVKAWLETLGDLYKYVKEVHTTGLVWGTGKGASGAAVPPPPPPAGMPPPPPPIADLSLQPDANDRSALFAEINQGEGITRNLKKVTSDMQTHKNPGLRTGPAPFKPTAVHSSVRHDLPGAPKAAPSKPPVFNRDGKKWLVEHQKGNHNLVIEGADMNNVVYMYGCQESTLTVKGKINSVFLDSCRKTSILVDSLVSSIEFVNCQSVQMQVLGKVPTISIDKTDGCQMYLSNESLDVEIVSSKSSEMNVLIPKGNGEYTELPIAEQFKTLVNRKGLVTTPVENKG
ncbi:hypothetical protein O3M35_008947 [Rhynocoris fuscipes]|uniref:Adenylyl cyclase-associated protein 1 n=1 Tax=Rhynocoris fuscipes TaxID=488301 RepID=A0AAW1D3G3_9HEMI